MIALFPKIVRCAHRKDIDRLGCLIRDYFGEKQKYAANLNIYDLFRQIDIPIDTMEYDAHGAIVVKDQAGVFTIHCILNSAIAKNNVGRIVLCHLLGRYLLHIQHDIAMGNVTTAGYKVASTPWERQPQATGSDENFAQLMEADAFAHSLLLPSGMVKKAMDTLQTRDKVAAFFNVPLEFLELRLNLLAKPAPTMSSPAEPASIDRAPQKTNTKIPDPNFEKVNRSIANSSYTKSHRAKPKKNQQDNLHKDATPANAAQPDGLSKIRSLAQKIDPTVSST